MRYTVWCRRRLIGETDLGFVRVVNQVRSGWFYPNAEGERVMPIVESALPAMREYLHRNAVDAAGNSLVQPATYESTEFADVAEAFQHLSSLDLELRREDGSVVPTSHIGIQDTEALLGLAGEAEEEEMNAASWSADDEPIEDDADIVGCMSDAAEPELDDIAEPGMDWMPVGIQEPPYPGYQIHVLLLEDDAIP